MDTDKQACATSGHGMTIGRAFGVHGAVSDHSDYANARLGADMRTHAVPAPLVHVGPDGDIQLPPGEAFTRATCLALVQEGALCAVRRDRMHLPRDGYTLRSEAVHAMRAMVAEVLTQVHAPDDAAAQILAQLTARAHAWAQAKS